MSDEDANLFTSDTSSGRELPDPPHTPSGLPRHLGPYTSVEYETPPLIKSVEDELPAYREARPIPQSSIDAARIAALEAENLKLRREWDGLDELDRQIYADLREERAKLRGALLAIVARSTSPDACRLAAEALA